MVASVLFKANNRQDEKRKSKRKFQFEKARNFYRNLLHRALKRRGLVLGGTFGLLVLSLAIVPFLGTEFMPAMDREMIMLQVKMPVGTSLEETNRVVTMVEKLMTQEPEVVNVSVQVGSQAEENPADMAGGMSTTGSHEGLLWVGLTPLGERDLSDIEVMEKIRRKLPKLKDVKFESLDLGQAMMGGATAPVEIKIFGKEIDILKEIGDSVVERIRDVEGLRDVTHSLAEGKPEYHITIEREKASRMGLKVSQVGSAIQTATLGKVATRFREGNEEIDIRVRLEEKFRDNLEDIRSIPIMTPLNTSVSLGEVATITQGEGPIRINRENQARVITVTGNIVGRDLGSVVKDIKARIADIERALPAGYFTEFGGQYEQMQEAFVIMAIIAMLVAGRPVSLPVLIGFIILGGIAVNNGIVMVDYINKLKQRGLDKKEAILQACAVRLRPVLITAFTTILGMMPMALSVSEGAEMRAPMAITVVGGLTATTFLTLFIIPIIYSLFERVKFKE
jgi:HAE1 family hydrophobic/amphiphilic exporter-1